MAALLNQLRISFCMALLSLPDEDEEEAGAAADDDDADEGEDCSAAALEEDAAGAATDEEGPVLGALGEGAADAVSAAVAGAELLLESPLEDE